tara:strand:+ start:277 stop:471 length:195 start_codon:yes stop_codon:yes gene_type:complete
MRKVIILLLIIFYMLIIFQGCSKENFGCDLDETIARVCNKYNNEDCTKEVIDILSYSCDINKTD